MSNYLSHCTCGKLPKIREVPNALDDGSAFVVECNYCIFHACATFRDQAIILWNQFILEKQKEKENGTTIN